MQVKPVRHYRAAKYPSHHDPDPTQFPQPVPYPASRKFIAAVASVGIAASTSCRPSSDTAATDTSNPVASNDPPTAASVLDGVASDRNPFSVKLSGLPYHSSAYGTGIPNDVDAETARVVIERVFQQAGYRLEHNVDHTSGSARFVADGYDAKRTVGYVFASWNNLDLDAILI